MPKSWILTFGDGQWDMNEDPQWVRCLEEFIDLEFEERRKPGDEWQTSPKRARSLESGNFLIRIDGPKENPIPEAEGWPWGSPLENRHLETALEIEGDWNRIVACLNIWNDLPALKESWETWLPYVDHVIAIDGAYSGAALSRSASTDGTVEFLRSHDKVELIEAPEKGFWQSQVEKRNEYFKASETGDLLFIIDADEKVENAAVLQNLPKFDVGWVPYHKKIYYKTQNFPRLYNANINPRYEGRHYWLFGKKGFITDCQYGGPGYDHRFVPLFIDNTHSRNLRTKERRQKQKQINMAKVARESKVGHKTLSGIESLRIVQLTSIDAGMVVFRLHSAINGSTPHESVMASSRHRSFQAPYQCDISDDREILRKALRECDIVHCHLSYQEFDRLGVATQAPVVIHHHGSMYRGAYNGINQRDAYKADVRLVSNPELLKYGENLNFLPNPVPVVRYRRMREALYEPDPDGYLRIGHSPSKRHLKGTEDLIQVVEELRSQGYKYKLVLIEDVSHAESLRMKASSCDIFFDSFWLGMQCSGLETAAMKIPVIAGDEDNYEYYKSALGHIPYLYANTKQTLREHLCNLYDDVCDRRDAGEYVFSYVQEHHDYAAVTKQYLDILDNKLNWRSRLSLGKDTFLRV